MSILTTLQTRVPALLQEYGEEVSMERKVYSSYDPSTSEATEDTPIIYSGYGLPTKYKTEDVDGENVLSTDVMLIFYSSTIPLEDDIATFNSTEYKVKAVQKVSVQGGFVLYKLQCGI